MMWLVIAGVAAVLGSVFMLKPSARDSRLAKLRFEAVKQGLQLRQFKWEPDSKKTGVYEPITATSYSLMRYGSNKAGEVVFSVVAQKGWETEHLPEGFSWHTQGTAAEAQKFNELLPQLQDELLLLEVRENQVLLMAKEKPTATAMSYKHFLESFL